MDKKLRTNEANYTRMTSMHCLGVQYQREQKFWHSCFITINITLLQ